MADGGEAHIRVVGRDEEQIYRRLSSRIHAAIKVSDALTTRFLGRVARRHEEAPALFLELIKRNHIPSEEARHRDVLSEAIRRKSAADYHAEFFSKRDAHDLMKKVEGSVKMAGKHCGA